MEITIEPEIYVPLCDDGGNYIDWSNITDNKRCVCNNNRVVHTPSSFRNHKKTQCHQKWLASINANKGNIFKENEILKNDVKIQKSIIGKMEITIQQLNLTNQHLFTTIAHLSNKLNNDNKETSINLLDL